MKHLSELTVVMPAYNEEGNIQEALRSVQKVLRRLIRSYEIIVVDDGSNDRTLASAQEVAKKNKNIRIESNPTNQGFGYSFMKGVRLAKSTFVTVFPSDNEMSSRSFEKLIRARHEADFIITFPEGHRVRPLLRRLFSWLFTRIMNTTFQLHIRYFNGPQIYRTEYVRLLPLISRRYTIFAEIIVRLHALGLRYKEIPFLYIPRSRGKSKAVGIRSFLSTALVYVLLIKDIYVTKRHYGISTY